MFYTFLVLTDYFQTSPLACSYSKFVTILFLRELSLSKHISKGNRIYGEERKEEAKLKRSRLPKRTLLRNSLFFIVFDGFV